MDADDIYGDDLLGGSTVQPSNASAPDASTIIIDYSSMSAEELRSALEEWDKTFQEERQDGGIFSGIVGAIEPLTILSELRRAHSSEQQARAEAAALRQRLAGAAAEAASRVQEDVLLRKELLAARTSTDPSVLQLRQLLLEPAVNREFSRLSKATEVATNLKNDMRLQLDMATNPSVPIGVADKIRTFEEKCEALQQANEEGEVAKVERALATARAQLEEMRHLYGELEDHTHSLEDELEVLQRDVVSAERRAAALTSSSGGGGGGGGLPSGAGGAPYHQQGGGWGRGHSMHHPSGPPGGGGGSGSGSGGYYNRGGGPQGHQQGMVSGGGGGKRPRDY